MKFQENITINYGKKDVDTTKFVTGYDSYSVSDINRHKNSKTITIDNYTIKCPTFFANKMGKQKLVYKVDNYSYPLYVTVKDKEKPIIEYQKDIDYTIDDKISIKKLFIINDNLTKKENLKIKYKGKIKNKVGKYKIICTVEDEAGNKNKATSTVHIYDKPTLSVSNKSVSLKVNQEVQINASTTGKENKCTYSSENEGIATVNENGLVKSINSGQTIIHIKANGLEEKVTVSVEDNQPTSPTTSNEKNSNTNNKNNDNSNSSKPSNNKSNSETSTNPSQYNKYFSGNSIDSYNSAYSYAENMMNSGKVHGYSVSPDGNGFNVTFN
nr:Ig-like domain-containing protein [uncultured Faecalibacillus sp.]